MCVCVWKENNFPERAYLLSMKKKGNAHVSQKPKPMGHKISWITMDPVAFLAPHLVRKYIIPGSLALPISQGSKRTSWRIEAMPLDPKTKKN